jgi:hypothetical protein
MSTQKYSRLRWKRALLATTAALSFGAQNAWAVCADGTTFPAGGYQIGVAPVQVAANWSPNVFTATAGSVFVPDGSTADQTTGAPTGGGHNWAFDQGSTTCKLGDAGSAAGTTGWIIPPNTATDCLVLPVIKKGAVVNLGDIPFQGGVVTPVCDPTKLSTATTPNPANTYANQLGCAISGGVATTAATASSYMFVAGIQGGLFNYELTPNGAVGKTVGSFGYYSDIPEGSKINMAAVSPDGMFATAISIRHGQQEAWACIDPLGNPGDPAKPLPPGFFIPSAASVFCGGIGQTGLATNLTMTFGPDNQPYFGGQRVMNTFLATPGGAQGGAWPQCIHFGGGAPNVSGFALHNAILADLSSSTYQTGNKTIPGALQANTANKCGTAFANSGFTSALITQPSSVQRHVNASGVGYMYTGPVGGTTVQFKLGTDAVGRTTYRFRTYLTGTSLSTGIGVADDLGSLMVMTDPSAVGLAGQGVITKLPLCEDM